MKSLKRLPLMNLHSSFTVNFKGPVYLIHSLRSLAIFKQFLRPKKRRSSDNEC